MKPQLRLSIVVVLLSCFCTFSSRQSIAETKSPEFLYALTETDAIQNSYRVVSDIRICGYHIDRTGELRATLQTTSIFAGSLAHLQAPLIARPKLSISAFGQSQIIVLLSAVMVGGGDINRTLAYEVRRDGTLKLLFNAQSANNTRFIEVDSVDSELYAVTTADGYQPNAVIKYGVSSSGALTKKWQLAGNITQVFVSPSGQFLYCICDPGLSNISSDYGGLAIYTYRVFTDQPPIFQG